jgi:type IV pilus assembly protein PilO
MLSEKLIDLRAMFPPVLNHDEVLAALKDVAEGSGLLIENIAFSQMERISYEPKQDTSGEEVSFAPITDERLKTAMNIFGIDASNDEGESGNEYEITDNKLVEGEGFALSLNIDAKSTNQQLMDFIYNIYSFNNKIAFENLQIDMKSGKYLQSRITLKFYGITDSKAVHKKNYINIDTLMPMALVDKDNIFEPYDDFDGSMITEENNNAIHGTINQTVDTGAYDFTMRVMPYGSNMAPPTVALVGRSVKVDNNSIGIPVVYGDSRENEKVDIYVEEKNGRLYCRFRTEHEAYPDKEFKNTIEFKPLTSSIRILIDSTKRVAQNDTSGVDITITNNTTGKISVDVLNEDKNRPRVRINRSDESVKVNYK